MSRVISKRQHHVPRSRGGTKVPFDSRMYIALAVIPSEKDVTIDWIKASQGRSTKDVVNRLIKHGLIEIEGDRVHITKSGKYYRDAMGNLIGLEQNGIKTDVQIKKPRSPKVNPEILRKELFSTARRYHKISSQEWGELGIRKQWAKIRVFLLDPEADRDRYYSIMTPKTKNVLRRKGLIK